MARWISGFWLVASALSGLSTGCSTMYNTEKGGRRRLSGTGVGTADRGRDRATRDRGRGRRAARGRGRRRDRQPTWTARNSGRTPDPPGGSGRQPGRRGVADELADVIQMASSQPPVSDEVIINQIRKTGSRSRSRRRDITYLKQNNVSRPGDQGDDQPGAGRVVGPRRGRWWSTRRPPPVVVYEPAVGAAGTPAVHYCAPPTARRSGYISDIAADHAAPVNVLNAAGRSGPRVCFRRRLLPATLRVILRPTIPPSRFRLESRRWSRLPAVLAVLSPRPPPPNDGKPNDWPQCRGPNRDGVSEGNRPAQEVARRTARRRSWTATGLRRRVRLAGRRRRADLRHRREGRQGMRLVPRREDRQAEVGNTVRRRRGRSGTTRGRGARRPYAGGKVYAHRRRRRPRLPRRRHRQGVWAKNYAKDFGGSDAGMGVQRVGAGRRRQADLHAGFGDGRRRRPERRPPAR